MRVVVDTNVFVSAALKDKSFPALALHIIEQRGTLLKSTATEGQLFAVLARPQLAALVDPAAGGWGCLWSGRGGCGGGRCGRGRKRWRSPSASPPAVTQLMINF